MNGGSILSKWFLYRLSLRLLDSRALARLILWPFISTLYSIIMFRVFLGFKGLGLVLNMFDANFLGPFITFIVILALGKVFSKNSPKGFCKACGETCRISFETICGHYYCGKRY
ncbi:hypothetical protein SteCoe_1657 [Stentor coeruleus]|uniref:Uncharacterized protein n=1 Tax=Stentor coeruleus TaxID=5963 RepID=A0A1R2D1H6_9CILI|nr:hypothetical protein SteCoe_1657 [Stentor coeruleus]